jgi:hypothetical protein
MVHVGTEGLGGGSMYFGLNEEREGIVHSGVICRLHELREGEAHMNVYVASQTSSSKPRAPYNREILGSNSNKLYAKFSGC